MIQSIRTALSEMFDRLLNDRYPQTHFCTEPPTIRDEEPPTTPMYHWVAGGGMWGCLYDHGPEFSDTREQALDSLIDTYGLSDREIRALESNGIVWFEGCRRFEAGVDYCELYRQRGPRPEES